MVASGLPESRDDHAEAVAEFALDLLDVVSRFNTSNRKASHLNRPPIAVRAGIDTGSAIAGIIGDKKFCYDVWGAGVDGAVAMEQDGVPNRIHVSQSAALRLHGLYHMDVREPSAHPQPAQTNRRPKMLKKVVAKTFFLTGRSKRVDFTKNPVSGAREPARREDVVAVPSLVQAHDSMRAEMSLCDTSLSSSNRADHRSGQPSVRVKRERRQSSTW